MNKILEEMLGYLNNATPEQLEDDWSRMNQVNFGPDADEFANSFGALPKYSAEVVYDFELEGCYFPNPYEGKKDNNYNLAA